MILYHGSNIAVENPKILISKRLLDFGSGFYLTSDFEQAKKWANRTAARRECGEPVVSVYELDEIAFKSLSVLTFSSANREWLDYVSTNRTDASFSDDFDAIRGPVANDQAIRTVNNFLKGYLPADMAIALLLPQNLKDQYAMKTENALKTLTFKEFIKV